MADSTHEPHDLASPVDESTDECLHGDPTGASDELSATEINELRKEIDQLDRTILESIQRRTEISQMIGQTRKKSAVPG